jgi:phosphoribosyl-ATP pyrophosphohydrolase
MPEGSYTTHLFNSGSAKIRKKLGEEAVRAFLAAKKIDISYERADPVFHMLVLAGK